ncbi:MAG: PEP-CTERM sorting domain-containing protein [Verrucomicrobiae bacterium]|nr:PEP-CTERM sorting domain-containing protein [Verrucomicrobiae bacterium]
MRPNSKLIDLVLWLTIFCAGAPTAPGTAEGAVSIDFTAGPGERSLITSTGAPVPDGNFVHVGSFATLFNVQANARDIGSLWSAFNVLGTTTVRTILGDPGRFGATSISTDPAFDGQQIYILLMLTVNQAPPTLTFDNVLEYGLFTNSASGDWIVPSQIAAVPSTLVGSSHVATAVYGGLSASNLALSPVPEPATGMLGALGLSALTLRRRRRWVSGSPRIAVAAGIALFLPCESVLALFTVEFTAQLGQRNVIDVDGGLLRAEGGEVRLGLLADFFDPEEHGDDLHRLREAWIPLGSTPIRSVLGEASRFSAAITSEDSLVQGAQLYLWILHTADGATVARDFSNVTEFGLYSSTHRNWTVPSEKQLPPENSTIINSSQIDLSFGPANITETSLQLSRPIPLDLDYGAWTTNAFPEGTPEQEKLPEADPDNDSLSNLLERFTGNSPVVADPQLPFQLTLTDNGIEFKFERARSVPAGVARVQISTNLTAWINAEIDPKTVRISPVPDIPAKDLVEILVSPDEASINIARELYVRLSVVEPTPKIPGLDE